ncbi:alpha/beta hydrolase [Acetobacteraceae bacterium H6797]|nr:alpha/beta hydrolase [Acetobacteraceae bacterium H6797]
MPTFKLSDGTRIFYKDWGSGQPVIFSHGWPLSADAWDAQMEFLGSYGFRVIAHDRRGHGRSDQTWDGNTMDQYVADYAELLDHLDVRNAVLVGHSTGGGEVARYIGSCGAGRVAKAVLVSAVPPLMLKTDANPDGTPLEVFDGLRKSLRENRAQLYRDLTLPFFGYNREGAQISEGVRQHFWLQGMMGGIKGQYDCVHEFSEIDYTGDLKRIPVPTLVVHGDDDQIVPIKAAGLRTAEIVPEATLKVYEDAPHGLPITHHQRLNRDLLEFIRD